MSDRLDDGKCIPHAMGELTKQHMLAPFPFLPLGYVPDGFENQAPVAEGPEFNAAFDRQFAAVLGAVNELAAPVAGFKQLPLELVERRAWNGGLEQLILALAKNLFAPIAVETLAATIPLDDPA